MNAFASRTPSRVETSLQKRRGFEKAIVLAPNAERVFYVQREYCKLRLRTADTWLLDELVTAKLAELARVEAL